jgi:geranylgeranyl pyrophosphate synthase
MVELKTGYYLGFTMTGAAIVAQAPQGIQDKLSMLGRLLGPAFQIRDDIIDLTEGKGRGGQIGCDIKEGKPSILLAATLAHCSAAERAELARILRMPREETSENDVRTVIGIFEKYDAVEFAQKSADDLVARALRIIEGIPFKEPETFRAFARFISARKS